MAEQGIRITLDKQDIERIRTRLQEQLRRFGEVRTPLMKIATQMYKSVMKNFQEQGTDKAKWQPLSPMTIALRRKGKAGGTPKILQDTGFLKMSIFPEVGENYATVGTNVPYARLHQFGGEIKVPARDIFPVRKKALRFMIDGREVFAKSVHQPERTAKVPARPFLVIRQQHWEAIKNIARRWFFEGQISE